MDQDRYRPSGKKRWSPGGGRGGRGGRPGGGSGGSFWDTELVSGIAFHPRKCRPQTRFEEGAGGWIDGDIALEDGNKLAYRLYVAPPRDVPQPLPAEEGEEPVEQSPQCVVVYFHANAELLSDIEEEVAAFYHCGVAAILCPEYRGFSWSSGSPKLSQLCPDAEAALEALPGLLGEAGAGHLRAAPVVVHGRSLGATCAIHLAACEATAPRLGGLVVESGCMSLLDLPMVQHMAAMMPQILVLAQSEPPPLHTMEKVRSVAIPALFVHGSRDEIVPVQQASAAHHTCQAEFRRLVLFSRAGHNNLRQVCEREYFQEFELLVDVARGAKPREALLAPRQEAGGGGFLGALSRTLTCIPGVERCIRQ